MRALCYIPTMRSAWTGIFLRLGGYACGVAGALILLYGRRQPAMPVWTRNAGFALMFLMVVLFVGAHAVQLIGRLTAPAGDRRRGPVDRDPKNPVPRR